MKYSQSSAGCSPKMARRKPAPPATAFEPHAVRDPASLLGGRFGRLVVLARTFCGYRAVYRRPNVDSQVGVLDRVIFDWQFPLYPKINHEEISLQSILNELKEDMLAHGASPEAVMLVGGHSPFNEEELKVMATKLAAKSGTQKPAAKKAAAPAKPKAERKAKESAGPDERKITVLKKEHGARAGTQRATMLDAIYKSKTVDEAVKNGATSGDVAWAARSGYISLK